MEARLIDKWLSEKRRVAKEASDELEMAEKLAREILSFADNGEKDKATDKKEMTRTVPAPKKRKKGFVRSAMLQALKEAVGGISPREMAALMESKGITTTYSNTVSQLNRFVDEKLATKPERALYKAV